MTRHRISACFTLLTLPFAFACGTSDPGAATSRLTFAVSIEPSTLAEAVDGRLLLMLAANDETEPRFQIGSGLESGIVYGIDVEALTPGTPAVFDANVFGYPVTSIADLEPGEYVVQALLHRYESFNLAGGQTVTLPMDRGGRPAPSTPRSQSTGARTTTFAISSSAIGRLLARSSKARSISTAATWTTTT